MSVLFFDFSAKGQETYKNSICYGVDSIKVVVQFDLYFIPPTREGIRMTNTKCDSIFTIYKNDSLFIMVNKKDSTEIVFGYESGVYEKFINLALSINDTVYNDSKNAYINFTGRVVLDYFSKGKVENSILVDKWGYFVLEGQKRVLYSKNFFDSIKKIFPNVFYMKD